MKFDIKGTLSPFWAIKKMLEQPGTIRYPEVKPDAVEGYRGFHANDLSVCIGCGNCQDVCMNDAIDMVPAEEEKNTKNASGLVPRIDYGRCCWCSLCTDVCPPDSLKLVSECIWTDSVSNNFLYRPKDQ